MGWNTIPSSERALRAANNKQNWKWKAFQLSNTNEWESYWRVWVWKATQHNDEATQYESESGPCRTCGRLPLISEWEWVRECELGHESVWTQSLGVEGHLRSVPDESIQKSIQKIRWRYGEDTMRNRNTKDGSLHKSIQDTHTPLEAGLAASYTHQLLIITITPQWGYTTSPHGLDTACLSLSTRTTRTSPLAG